MLRSLLLMPRDAMCFVTDRNFALGDEPQDGLQILLGGKLHAKPTTRLIDMRGLYVCAR
jgi:hypothetical protein